MLCFHLNHVLSKLIGKFSITDECKIAVGIDGNKIYLQARKNIGNALDKILHLAFNYNTGKFQLNQMHNGIWEGERTIITTSDLESFGFPSTRIITDLHTIQQSCFFMYIAGAANAPLSDRGGIGICIYAGNAWRYLLVIPYNTIDMYVSTINSEGLWTTWTKK